MADIREVDIRLVLGRLRPGSAYHWRGSGATGNGYDAIGEWRDPRTDKPTLAELLAEWEVYRQEQAAAEQTRQQRRQKLDGLRQSNRSDLDLAKFAGQSPLDDLARKVAWLEQEIHDLRGE
ncbi:MAG: hypothetical protein HZC41_24285 [Chloroflexi bacterium]|nr:hypothetical protein [Chloroflexota bacterium]